MIMKIVSYDADDNGMFVCWQGERIEGVKFSPMTIQLYEFIGKIGALKEKDEGLALLRIRTIQKFYARKGKSFALRLKHFEDVLDW